MHNRQGLGYHLTPLGETAQQSDSAARITRIRCPVGEPMKGGLRFSWSPHGAGNSRPDPALVSRFFQLVNSEQQLFSIKDARHMTKPLSQNAIGRAQGVRA